MKYISGFFGLIGAKRFVKSKPFLHNWGYYSFKDFLTYGNLMNVIYTRPESREAVTTSTVGHILDTLLLVPRYTSGGPFIFPASSISKVTKAKHL